MNTEGLYYNMAFIYDWNSYIAKGGVMELNQAV